MEKHGGPSRQTMSNIMNDTRKVLTQRPSQEIVEKIALAFRMPVEQVLVAVAKAMGFPIEVVAADLEDASDEDLLEEIRKRMNRESSEHDTDDQDNQQPDDKSSNVVEADFATEDVEPEQKIAAYDRELGDGIGPGDLPEDS